jgi:hypothetical protein
MAKETSESFGNERFVVQSVDEVRPLHLGGSTLTLQTSTFLEVTTVR